MTSSPFERPGETPQGTGRRFEKFWAKFFGRDPQRGSGSVWHMPLDVGTAALLFSLKFSSNDTLKFGSRRVKDLFREIDQSADDRTGALAVYGDPDSEVYVILRGHDFLRMAQTGDIHYITPTKADQKRSLSRVPALLREDENG